MALINTAALRATLDSESWPTTFLTPVNILPTAEFADRLCVSVLITLATLEITLATFVDCTMARTNDVALSIMLFDETACVAARNKVSIRDAAAFAVIDCINVLYI